MSARPAPLRADGLLASELWLDQPDAHDRIEQRRERGRLGAEEARELHRFVERGYLVFRPRLDPALAAEIIADADRAWREQPPTLAFAYQGLLTRFSGNDQHNRRPSCRIADLHAYSAAALALYLDPDIHRMVSLVFGEQAVATQSLYFEWGSGQALHRDPMHVQMGRPEHLLAAWVALEDISADCGPLVYVPGSHRLPYYQFEPGRFVYDHDRDGAAAIGRAESFDADHCRLADLAVEPFTCRRGDVLIWHHSLLHGGSHPKDLALTRHSFVVHFTTRAHMGTTRNTYRDPLIAPAGHQPVERVLATDRVLERAGACGFASPLAAYAPAELAELHAAARQRSAELAALRLELDAAAGELAAMRQSRFWRLRNAWFACKRALGLISER